MPTQIIAVGNTRLLYHVYVDTLQGDGKGRGGSGLRSATTIPYFLNLPLLWTS